MYVYGTALKSLVKEVKKIQYLLRQELFQVSLEEFSIKLAHC